MRDLHTIIRVVRCFIPSRYSVLDSKLESMMSSVSYCPPESINMWWKELCFTLEYEIKPEDINSTWEKSIRAIINDEKIELIG